MNENGSNIPTPEGDGHNEMPEEPGLGSGSSGLSNPPSEGSGGDGAEDIYL